MEPKEESVWIYDPSFPLAIVGCIIYGLIFLIITYLTFIKYRAWYFSVVVVGGAVELLGYASRVYSTKHQTELPPFVMSLTLIVLAPVLIAAGNYLLITRLIQSVLPPAQRRIFGIPGKHLTTIFVCFDVFAFLLQGGGSGIASSGNWTGEKERIGRYTIIGGLVFQLICFCLFLAVFRRFHQLGKRSHTPGSSEGWKKVVLAVYISSIMIVIRCIYRVCEFSEGVQGYAFRNEWLFWVFEALPMIIGIGVFCVIHPSRYLSRTILDRKSYDDIEMSNSTRHNTRA